VPRGGRERLGLVIAPSAVFVDNNRSAWQRTRNRPGWNTLLDVIRAGRVGHVIVYHPDRLMRQPRNLEELLAFRKSMILRCTARPIAGICLIRMIGFFCGSRLRVAPRP
jgi:hypothetical protein